MNDSRSIYEMLATLPRRLGASVRSRGFVATLRLFVRRLLRRACPGLLEATAAWIVRRDEERLDRCFGTDISAGSRGTVDDAPDATRAHGRRYESADRWTVVHVLRALPIDPTGYDFVDLGSGKGRVLWLAAEHGFRTVLGVEHSPALHASAERNIERFQHAAGTQRDVRCVVGDAREVEWPERPLVVFLFNPFDAATMDVVMARLRESLVRAPRPAFVIYVNPCYAANVADGEALHPWMNGVGFLGNDFIVYANDRARDLTATTSRQTTAAAQTVGSAAPRKGRMRSTYQRSKA